MKDRQWWVSLSTGNSNLNLLNYRETLLHPYTSGLRCCVMIDCFSDKTYIYGFVKETSYFSSINGVEDQLLRDYRVISNQYSFTMIMLVGSDLWHVMPGWLGAEIIHRKWTHYLITARKILGGLAWVETVYVACEWFSNFSKNHACVIKINCGAKITGE